MPSIAPGANFGDHMKGKGINHLSSLALAALVVLASPDISAGKIKCWTNGDGFRECGNVVPPEYAQQGHEEVGEHGLTVKTKQRARTNEELEAERIEQERLEAQRKLDEEQAKHDRILLATYATEYDMRLAHKGRIAAIDSRVTHAEHLVKKLKEKLVELIGNAADQERAGKEVSADTLTDIRVVKQQIEEQREFIDERELEKGQINARFEDELAHFRRLKSR